MPTTVIAVQDLTGTLYSQTGTALTMTAADVANGNHFLAAGITHVIAHNTGGVSYTVTITSIADSVTGRTGHVTAQSLAAGEIRSFLLPLAGWADTTASNKVLISASNAAVKFGLAKVRT